MPRIDFRQGWSYRLATAFIRSVSDSCLSASEAVALASADAFHSDGLSFPEWVAIFGSKRQRPKADKRSSTAVCFSSGGRLRLQPFRITHYLLIAYGTSGMGDSFVDG